MQSAIRAIAQSPLALALLIAPAAAQDAVLYNGKIVTLDARSSIQEAVAVLTKDYLTVPAGEIGGIESLLTMVGGRIVYAAAPFAALEERAGN